MAVRQVLRAPDALSKGLITRDGFAALVRECGLKAARAKRFVFEYDPEAYGDVMQISSNVVRSDTPIFDDFETSSNDYVDIPVHWPRAESEAILYWPTPTLATKILWLYAADHALSVKVLGSLDNGVTFPVEEGTISVSVSDTPTEMIISDIYTAIKIQVKPSVEDENGTLSIQAFGTSLFATSDVEITVSGDVAKSDKQDAQILVEQAIRDRIGALTDPAAGSTNKLLIDIWSKLSSDFATQTTLAAILAKIITAPATAEKQDALAALVGEVQASPTAYTMQARLKALETVLGGIDGAAVVTDANGTAQQYLRGLVKLWGLGLPAGAQILGKTGIDQTTPGTTNRTVAGYDYSKTKITFTGTGAYSQYDQVGVLTEIPNFAAYAGGAGRITEMRITCAKKTVLPQFEVHLFKTSDATMAGDNGAWDERFEDEDKRAGYIIMPTLAVSNGSASIDFSRIQHDDYGVALSKDIKCAVGATSIWVALKLVNAPATAFDGAPGNSISVHLGWMRS